MNLENLGVTDVMNEAFFLGPRHPHPPHHHPLPPHMRRGGVRFSFDEADLEILRDVFGDEDTARAAARIIAMAPPEMQVLAFQFIDMIQEVA